MAYIADTWHLKPKQTVTIKFNGHQNAGWYITLDDPDGHLYLWEDGTWKDSMFDPFAGKFHYSKTSADAIDRAEKFGYAYVTIVR